METRRNECRHAAGRPGRRETVERGREKRRGTAFYRFQYQERKLTLPGCYANPRWGEESKNKSTVSPSYSSIAIVRLKLWLTSPRPRISPFYSESRKNSFFKPRKSRRKPPNRAVTENNSKSRRKAFKSRRKSRKISFFNRKIPFLPPKIPFFRFFSKSR